MSEYQNNRPSRSGGNNDQNGGDLGSWIFIAIMFAVAWPVGLIMLLVKLSDSSGRKKPQTRSKTGTTTAHSAAAAREKMVKTPQFSAKGAQRMKTIGTILAVLGGVAFMAAFRDNLFWLEDGGIANLRYVRYFLEGIFYPTGLLAGGLGLLAGGQGMTRRARRFGKYLAMAGDRGSVSISQLAEAAGVSARKTEKDLELMIERGLWGEGAYLDLSRGILFRSHTEQEKYEQEKTQQAKPLTPPQAQQGYSGMLRDIRQANDRIADPIISAKIDRLEEIAGKIFRIVEEEPKKKDKAATFLNYYLPTTQKLLDSYAEFEEAGVSGTNVSQAKEKIEKTMDAIVAGFERQLDQLYQDDAMDIDSDIRVMETMLRRDSRTVEDDFGLGSAAAVQEETE